MESGLHDYEPPASHEYHTGPTNISHHEHTNPLSTLAGHEDAPACDRPHNDIGEVMNAYKRELNEIVNKRRQAATEVSEAVRTSTAKTGNDGRPPNYVGEVMTAYKRHLKEIVTKRRHSALEVAEAVRASMAKALTDGNSYQLPKSKDGTESYVEEDGEIAYIHKAQRHQRWEGNWTDEETTALREGVRRFGRDWKTIKQVYLKQLSQRSMVDLNYKWIDEVRRLH